jgi:hypothetical protein
MAAKKQKRQPTGDYAVGYCRPPAQHRFRSGQSGNPTGQRKGNAIKSAADELKEIVNTKIAIRDGGRTRKVSLISAILLAHAMNGAKGDAKSAALFFNQAQKLGLFDRQAFGDIPAGPQSKPRPSDLVLADLDPSLLSREEQVELSKLAAVIDRAGDVFALSTGELERLREFINKGRGNVVHFPRQPAS